MLKRLKVWTYLMVACGAGLYQFGCSGSWWPWGSDNAVVRIITAVLREDIFG
jgi:hypothetical protein